MTKKPAWYVLGQGKVMSVSDAPVNVEDLEERGFSVVYSDWHEPEIDKIKEFKYGLPVLKDNLRVVTTKISDEVVHLAVLSETYQGEVELDIYGTKLPIETNQTIPIRILPDYPLGVYINNTHFWVTYESEGF